MNKKRNAPQIRRRANQIIKQSGILESAYFKDLKPGKMSLAQFRKTQDQFYYAVLFFARPMGALVARMPNPRMPELLLLLFHPWRQQSIFSTFNDVIAL